MKPWEETWRAEHEDGLDFITEGPDGFIAGFDDQKERARLAAAAPEAMRLLLALEWSADQVVGYDGETEKCCPSCRGLQPEAVDPRPVGHAEDCALVALLQKVGVRGTEE